MERDPQVDLIFSHFIPRYEATGVDPNDLRALMPRIDAVAGLVPHLVRGRRAARGAGRGSAGQGATAGPRRKHSCARRSTTTTASTCSPTGRRSSARRTMPCCAAIPGGRAGPRSADRTRRVSLPGREMPGWLRKPRDGWRPPVAIILPGLDACKEELHAWAESFVDRGVAALTLDGPGQGETSFHLPVTHEWGPAIGAVIDVLEQRDDVDGSRVGVVGQSLGALYAPLAAAGEPRLKACIANCGPFDWGTVLPKMPKVSQEVFRVRSHSKTHRGMSRARQGADARGTGAEHQMSLAGDFRRRGPPHPSRRRRTAGAGGVRAVRTGRLPGRQSRLLQHQLQVPAAVRRLDGDDAGTRVKPARIGTELARATILETYRYHQGDGICRG